MRPSTLVLGAVGLAFVLGAGAGLSAQVLYVDPVGGQDTSLGGGPTNPLKTITFAVTRYAGKPSTLDLRLLPGQYDPASGESFPIVLPPRAAVKGVKPGSVNVKKTSMQLTTVFSATDAEDLRFEDLQIGSPDRGVQCTNNPGKNLTLALVRVRMGNSRDLAVNVNGSIAAVTLVGCDLGGGDTGVRANVQGGGTANLTIDRSIIRKVWHGVSLNATGQGSTIASVIRNTLFNAPGVNGVLSQANQGGQITSWIEGAVFYKCGGATIPNRGKGLNDVWDSQSTPPRHGVANSAFFQNGTDMPAYAPANYLLKKNLVQDANLVGIGGNITGDPRFLDASRDDFRLKHDSPCRDRGDNAAVTAAVDFDGDPRIDPGALGGKAIVDIGAHEYYPFLLTATPEPARLGFMLRVRFVGPPGALAFLGLGSGVDPAAPFGNRFRLLGFQNATIVGPVGNDHTLPLAFPVPQQPTLVGLVLYWQAAFAHPGGLTFGYNVLRQTFTP